eukprot:3194004-Rhodomonas_salina.3
MPNSSPDRSPASSASKGSSRGARSVSRSPIRRKSPPPRRSRSPVARPVGRNSRSPVARRTRSRSRDRVVRRYHLSFCLRARCVMSCPDICYAVPNTDAPHHQRGSIPLPLWHKCALLTHSCPH